MFDYRKKVRKIAAVAGLAVASGGLVGILGSAVGASAAQEVGHVWVYEICDDNPNYAGTGFVIRIHEKIAGEQYDEFAIDSTTYFTNFLTAQNSQWNFGDLFIPLPEGDYTFYFDGPVLYDSGNGSVEYPELELPLDLDCTDGGGDPPPYLDLDLDLNFTLTTVPSALPKTGTDSSPMFVLAPVMVLLGGGLILARRRLAGA